MHNLSPGTLYFRPTELEFDQDANDTYFLESTEEQEDLSLSELQQLIGSLEKRIAKLESQYPFRGE